LTKEWDSKQNGQEWPFVVYEKEEIKQHT